MSVAMIGLHNKEDFVEPPKASKIRIKNKIQSSAKMPKK